MTLWAEITNESISLNCFSLNKSEVSEKVYMIYMEILYLQF